MTIQNPHPSNKKIPIIGLAGGSGSGKTTLAKQLAKDPALSSILLPMDCYYKDLSSLQQAIREKTNFDHPDAIDFDLFAIHLSELAQGRTIDAPIYDFHTHTRDGQQTIHPADLILTEGTLLLASSTLSSLFDLKVFINTPADIRLLRRIRRDLHERGRSLDSICRQYLSTVRPMFEQFVLPTRLYADVELDGERDIDVLVQLLKHEIKQRFVL